MNRFGKMLRIGEGHMCSQDIVKESCSRPGDDKRSSRECMVFRTTGGCNRNLHIDCYCADRQPSFQFLDCGNHGIIRCISSVPRTKTMTGLNFVNEKSPFILGTYPKTVGT
jgi:hypothetical protein